ncbi:MAG: hypothetical protein Q8R02_06220 [Hyphomonadaceae bacterium]|nr:hypothetical protein [Hyphomonadaceae bacterium]
MSRFAISTALLALGFFAAPLPAAAQQDALGEAATKLYTACIANTQGGSAECACVAGFFAGRLQEDEYRIVGAINKFIDAQGNIADMDGALAAAEAERVRIGMTKARYTEVMQRFTTVDKDGAYGDRACSAFASVAQ